MDFKSYLETNAKDINEQLDLIFALFLSEVKQTNIKLLLFAKKLINSNKGGKRVRGILVKLGFEIGGGFANTEITKIGAAFEILHTALLIHDDIIDQSLERRGRPSLYQCLGGNHYGISQAISIGDVGLYLPIKIITDSKFSDKYKIKALKLLSASIINTGWGQVLDVVGSKDDVEFIRLYKTALYTVASPLQIGAILAGADENLVKKLGEFGKNLGIAFQIRDDILDGQAQGDARKEALKYINKARKMVPRLTKDDRMVNLLEEMAEYLVQRTK